MIDGCVAEVDAATEPLADSVARGAGTTLTGQPAGPWVEGTFTTERLVVGVQTPVGGGPTYRQERVRHLEDSGPSTTYDLWRQDRSGLFLYQPDFARTPRPLPLALARSLAGAPQAAAFARAYDAIAAKRAALTAGPVAAQSPVQPTGPVATASQPLAPGQASLPTTPATTSSRASASSWA